MSYATDVRALVELAYRSAHEFSASLIGIEDSLPPTRAKAALRRTVTSATEALAHLSNVEYLVSSDPFSKLEALASLQGARTSIGEATRGLQRCSRLGAFRDEVHHELTEKAKETLALAMASTVAIRGRAPASE